MRRGKKFILKRAKELGLTRQKINATKYFEEIPLSKFESYRHGAKIRNMVFNIKIEEVWSLFLKQNRKCALTGWDINFGKSISASIDRIDSKKGYTSDNIQLIHKDINILKMDWPESFLFDASKAIFLMNQNKFKKKVTEWETNDWLDTSFPKQNTVRIDEIHKSSMEKELKIEELL